MEPGLSLVHSYTMNGGGGQTPHTDFNVFFKELIRKPQVFVAIICCIYKFLVELSIFSRHHVNQGSISSRIHLTPNPNNDFKDFKISSTGSQAHKIYSRGGRDPWFGRL